MLILLGANFLFVKFITNVSKYNRLNYVKIHFCIFLNHFNLKMCTGKWQAVNGYLEFSNFNNVLNIYYIFLTYIFVSLRRPDNSSSYTFSLYNPTEVKQLLSTINVKKYNSLIQYNISLTLKIRCKLNFELQE